MALTFAALTGIEDAGAVSTPSISVVANDGEGNIVQPGRSCAETGTTGEAGGAYWHYDYGSKQPANVFSKLPGETRVHLDLHSDEVRQPNTSGAYPPAVNPTAFLNTEQSHISILNSRGQVKLRLKSGDCNNPTLNFDGKHASGSGTWVLDPLTSGTGSYRNITSTTPEANRTFTLTNAEVNPGADNALNLTLNNTNWQVLQPSFKLEKLDTYWANLGTDYLTRRTTVVYRITNEGPGDSYGTRLVSTSSSSSGVTPLGPQPQALGDLLAGQSAIVQVRYQLGLLAPCFLVVLNCEFNTTVTVDMPDALDDSHVMSKSVKVKSPLLPPPLS